MKNNILLIEDDLFFQKFYSEKLRESEYFVDVASNGEEGLEKVKKNQFDLIMLDLIMPKMDGFDVLKARLSDEDLKKIPVLVFTTLGQEEDIEKAKKLGANDYINKTFYNFGFLLEKVQSLLG